MRSLITSTILILVAQTPDLRSALAAAPLTNEDSGFLRLPGRPQIGAKCDLTDRDNRENR